MAPTTSRRAANPEDIVQAFDPSGRTWVTAGASGEKLPGLDGVLISPPEALKEAADDFGHVVSRQPSAILQPGSAEDIARMVRFARKHRLKIGPRGAAHTMFGQAQVDAGIVIDMSTLATIHEVREDRVDVDAGLLWRDLVARVVPMGRTPPVLTDVLELSVGGTLSVGGVSGSSFRHGVQLDNVLELQVVTGTGEKETCSPSQKPDLFEAALAGLGQCGIIVRATLKLIPAPTHVRRFELSYTDLGALIRDELLMSDDGRFDYVGGTILPLESGGWAYQTLAAAFYSQPAAPDDARLLAGLSHQGGTVQIRDMTYQDWVNRLVEPMAELRSLGHFGRAHPWCDLFVPASRLEAFLTGALKELTSAEITPFFPVLTYPFKRARVRQPLFRVPEEDFFLLDILRTVGPGTKDAAQMVEHNRQLFERNRDNGGTHYVISAIACGPEDWKRHYGPAWEGFAAAKRRYDPDLVLTPGPGIFG
jgi:cytokinin dehydrogenase